MAREPDVALLMTACGSFGIFLTPLLRMKLFLQFSTYHTTKPSATACSTRSRINSKKHVIKERIHTFTIVRNCWFCLKMDTLVGKLVALSVEKYYVALTEIQLKKCRFYGSLSQKGSRPLRWTMNISWKWPSHSVAAEWYCSKVVLWLYSISNAQFWTTLAVYTDTYRKLIFE